MSVKFKGLKSISPRTYIYILIILVIIGIAYLLVTTYSGESKNVLSVKDVYNQAEELVKTQEEITVEGYFNQIHNETIAQVTDSVTSPGEIVDILLVDHSGVKNIDLTEGSKYHFTGVLYSTENPNVLKLKASKIE